MKSRNQEEAKEKEEIVPDWYQRLRKYFPPNEMKSLAHMQSLLSNEAKIYKIENKIETLSEIENQAIVLTIGTFPRFIFIDYIHVDAQHRSKRLGSKMINHLKRNNKPIVLEIDNPANYASESDERKRFHFYVQNGFRIAPRIKYTHRSRLEPDIFTDMRVLFWIPIGFQPPRPSSFSSSSFSPSSSSTVIDFPEMTTSTTTTTTTTTTDEEEERLERFIFDCFKQAYNEIHSFRNKELYGRSMYDVEKALAFLDREEAAKINQF